MVMSRHSEAQCQTDNLGNAFDSRRHIKRTDTHCLDHYLKQKKASTCDDKVFPVFVTPNECDFTPTPC